MPNSLEFLLSCPAHVVTEEMLFTYSKVALQEACKHLGVKFKHSENKMQLIVKIRDAVKSSERL